MKAFIQLLQIKYLLLVVASPVIRNQQNPTLIIMSQLIPIIISKMKFVIKSGSLVKLYSGQIKIEALAQFLKERFSSWNSNNLTYMDKDGDRIVLATQEDLQVIQALNPQSQYIKLQISDEKEQFVELFQQARMPPTNQNQNQIEIQKETQSKDQESAQKTDKPQSGSPGKSKEQQRRRGKWNDDSTRKRSCQRYRGCQNQQQGQRDNWRQERSKALQELITVKITQIIDQRIKNMIPYIKNQLQPVIQSLVDQRSTQTKHQGVSCSHCNKNPIQGVRYKCLECPSFDLCSKCELSVDHEHDLLKMKRAQINIRRQDSGKEGLFRIGRKLLKQLSRQNSSSGTQNQGHRHHGHWRGKHGFSSVEKRQHRINKRLFKLKAVFGQSQEYKEFIKKNFDLKARDLINLYAAQNNISAEQFQGKRDQMRKGKLAAFYDCPEEQFNDVVKQYPTLNFRDIILKLKQTGSRMYTGENFKRMRQTFRDNKCGISKCPKEQQSKSKDQCCGKLMTAGSLINQKGDILNEMKSLFGEEKDRNYSQFIQRNFELGKQGLISKWIQKLLL